MVGRKIVRLLGGLDSSLTRPDRLSEIIRSLRSPVSLLLDPHVRTELLLLLSPGEACVLCQRLGLPDSSPYDSLAEVRIRRGSGRAAILFDFFGLEDDRVEQDLPPGYEEISPEYALFRHQREAAYQVQRLLDEEPHRVMLHMPTGSGKTRTAMSVIADRMGATEPALVLWLAHSEELCEQAVEEFRKAWSARGNRQVEVRRWWGPYAMDGGPIEDGLVVAGLQKVYSELKNSIGRLGAIAARANLVVMDEAHQAIAPTYRTLLDLLTESGRPTPLLGLTATPGRTWNDVDEDQRLADFFYRRKVSLAVEGYDNPVRYLIDEGYLAETEFQQLTYTANYELSDEDLAEIQEAFDIPASIIETLAADEQRNLLILNRAEEMCRRHRRFIIFAATKEHAVVLATVLRARGVWAHAVTGETPGPERARIIAAYKEDSDEPRILVNFGVLTTGFDAPRTSGAIIARPTKSLVLFSQMVGRATRGTKAGGNKHAEVVTVVDTRLPGFCNMAEAFENWEDVW